MKKSIRIFTFILFMTANTSLAGAMTVIDFEDYALGQPLNNQYAHLGVTFTPLGDAEGLYVAPLPEDIYPGASIAVHNSFDGGPYLDVQIDFSTAINWFSVQAIDADESMYLRAYLDETEIGNVFLPAGPDTSMQTVAIGGIGNFNRVILDINNSLNVFAGPEWFDKVAFNTVETVDPNAPVPEPATMLLLGAGLIGLGCLRRRQKECQINGK